MISTGGSDCDVNSAHYSFKSLKYISFFVCTAEACLIRSKTTLKKLKIKICIKIILKIVFFDSKYFYLPRHSVGIIIESLLKKKRAISASENN